MIVILKIEYDIRDYILPIYLLRRWDLIFYKIEEH